MRFEVYVVVMGTFILPFFDFFNYWFFAVLSL